MTKIHSLSDVTAHPALGACRVLHVDCANAVCMVHNPACRWATPYGNYCEHPLKAQFAAYDAAEARSPAGPLH